jgi:GNAT superfamily N-acetyltransferase
MDRTPERLGRMTQPERRHYDVRPVETSAAALAEVVDLFVRGGSLRTTSSAYLDWLYRQNPLGPVIGFNAYYEGRLASHYVALPTRARVFGHEELGLVSVNTRTDEAHQGQGLFTRLARDTYEYAQARGFGFVVGAANQNSVHGFTTKLGFQHGGRLETRFLLAVRPIEATGLDYESAWTPETLAWRLSKPFNSYRSASVAGRRLIFGHSRRFTALLDQVPEVTAATIAPPGSQPSIAMWVGLGGDHSWRSAVNLRTPEWLKDARLHFIFRDLQGDRALNPSKVRFSSLDFDAY